MRSEERRQQELISRLRVQLEEARKSEEEARTRTASVEHDSGLWTRGWRQNPTIFKKMEYKRSLNHDWL